jgi:O-antigen/teichoic acid export membrane protein
MALAGWGVWALVGQSLTSTVINTLILSTMVSWRPKLVFSVDSAKKLMKYGSGVLGAELSATFFLELRTLVVGRVFSSADLAYYNKGRQIPVLLTSNLSSTIMTVMFPALANRSDDLVQVKQMAKRSIRVLSYILVPCMFGLSAVMEPMILLLYTEKWAQTIPFGQLLAVGLCIDIVGSLPLQTLKAIGRSDVVLKLEVWKKPVYVLMLLIGIQFDVYTLAVLMVLYDVYSVAINMLQMKKYLPYGIKEQLRDLLPAYALGTVMMALVYLIPGFDSLILTLAVKIAAGAAIYLGGSVLFRVESFRYMWNILKGYLKK